MIISRRNEVDQVMAVTLTRGFRAARAAGIAPRPDRRATAVLSAVLLGGIALPPALSAQTSPSPPGLVHEKWTIEDGLPLSHLTGVVFASDGYLWMSSYDGLIRFDGARFEVFNTATNPELPTNRFRHVVEGPDGALWAGAEFDHVVRWRGDEFDVFTLPEVRGAAIGHLQFDPKGTLWVVTNRGLFRFREGRLEPLPGGIRPGLYGAVYWDRHGTPWIGTDGAGALRWKDGRFEQVISRFVSGFAEDAAGTLYIGTGAGVFAWRGDSLEPVRRERAGPLLVRAMKRLSADSILVIAEQGMFDLVGGRLSLRHPTGARTPTPVLTIETPSGVRWMSVDDDVYRDGKRVFDGEFPVHGLAVDHEGSLWIAVDGLHRLKPALFEVYGEPEGGAENVYGIMEDSRGRIWLSSLVGGTLRIVDGRVERLQTMPNLVQTFLEDRSGDLWVGRINYGACRIVELACRGRLEFLDRHTVKALYQDRAGSIWFGTDRGVYRDSAGKVTHFGVGDGLPHAFVRVIRQTRDGAMWFGTNGGGLARLADGRLESLGTAEGLPSGLVRAIHEDERGVLWIGAEDAGLVRLDFPDVPTDSTPPLEARRIRVIDRGAGLYDDGVHAILDDGRGRFWMSTNRGIFWVHKSELDDFAAGDIPAVHSISYTERDGLRNREANGGVQTPAIVASDGRLWFATQAGVVVVDPARIDRPDVPFPVKVETLTSREGTIPAPAKAGAAALELASRTRDFEIAYTGLSFLAPENLRFQYRLTGFQGELVDAGNRRTAFFTNVPAGSYVFQVRATRGDGVWYETDSPLAVAVAPRFHETALFRVSLVAALILLGVTGLRAREHRHRRRTEELSALVAERTATIEAQAERLVELDAAKSHFFANVSHEFRTPLTLTIGPLEDLRSGLHGPLPPEIAEQVDVSLRNSRRLLRLVNQLMDVARLEAGVVHLRAVERDLGAFLRDVLQAFEPLAERKRISATLELPDESLPVYFDHELMERVFANLLSNAFKFTPEGGSIRVEARLEPEGRIAVDVRDSGPGIAPERLPRIFERFYQADQPRETRQAGSGIGLSLAQELTRLHGGRLDVESTLGFGTTFTVRLRTGSSHLEPEQIASEPGASIPAPPSRVPPGETGDVDEGEDRVAEEADAVEDDRADIPTVLVVEDNPEVAGYVRKHLAPRFRIVEARDGVEAVARAREELPDVVVSDVMMPRMDGLELVAALRGDRDLAYIPVLLLTARADQADRLRALELGAADYLTKPFDVSELEARVRNLIETRHRLHERVALEAKLRPRPVAVETAADRFLERLRDCIEAHLSDETFDVRALAGAMGESRSSLYRHTMELCGQSPSDVLRSMRVERAAQILEDGDATVGEVAYAVGFKSVSHFSRCFREAYDVPPSLYGGQPRPH